jgi:hypothetical protein
MDLGVRSIRSSGAGSGSVEITLPAALRPLLGVPCRVSLRDGHRPEIVLTPDFRPAISAFADLWAKLSVAFGAECCSGGLPIGEFGVSLGQTKEQGAASLALLDGLALAGAPPHDPAAFARVTAGLAARLALALEIDPDFAREFAAATAYVVTGIVNSTSCREICDIVAVLLRPMRAEAGSAFARLGEDATSPALWRELAGPLQAVRAHFLAWSRDPIERHTLGAAWRRGLSLELKEH